MATEYATSGRVWVEQYNKQGTDEALILFEKKSVDLVGKGHSIRDMLGQRLVTGYLVLLGLLGNLAQGGSNEKIQEISQISRYGDSA